MEEKGLAEESVKPEAKCTQPERVVVPKTNMDRLKEMLMPVKDKLDVKTAGMGIRG